VETTGTHMTLRDLGVNRRAYSTALVSADARERDRELAMRVWWIGGCCGCRPMQNKPLALLLALSTFAMPIHSAYATIPATSAPYTPPSIFDGATLTGARVEALVDAEPMEKHALIGWSRCADLTRPTGFAFFDHCVTFTTGTRSERMTYVLSDQRCPTGAIFPSCYSGYVVAVRTTSKTYPVFSSGIETQLTDTESRVGTKVLIGSIDGAPAPEVYALSKPLLRGRTEITGSTIYTKLTDGAGLVLAEMLDTVAYGSTFDTRSCEDVGDALTARQAAAADRANTQASFGIALASGFIGVAVVAGAGVAIVLTGGTASPAVFALGLAAISASATVGNMILTSQSREDHSRAVENGQKAKEACEAAQRIQEEAENLKTIDGTVDQNQQQTSGANTSWEQALNSLQDDDECDGTTTVIAGKCTYFCYEHMESEGCMVTCSRECTE
jgi:hypothetical protein